jgi:hypothetical protein
MLFPSVIRVAGYWLLVVCGASAAGTGSTHKTTDNQQPATERPMET